MIEIIKKNNTEPYLKFYKLLDKAIKHNQKPHDAISISSYDHLNKQVNSRFVNLKYIDNENWSFFSNYDGQKARDFKTHNQITALIYWNEIDVQIRMKAKIKVSSKTFSDEHFKKRSIEKNALAISSKQSKKISSYDDVKKNYQKILNSGTNMLERPSYWGGFTFTPFYFEFWSGDLSRINKREVFEKKDILWEKYFLQP